MVEVVKLIDTLSPFTKEEVKFLKAAKVGVPITEAGEKEIEKFSKAGIIRVSPVSHPSVTDLPLYVVNLTDDGERLINTILLQSDENDLFGGPGAPIPFVDSKYRDEMAKKQADKLSMVQDGDKPLEGLIQDIADKDRPQTKKIKSPGRPEKLTDEELVEVGAMDEGVAEAKEEKAKEDQNKK